MERARKRKWKEMGSREPTLPFSNHNKWVMDLHFVISEMTNAWTVFEHLKSGFIPRQINLCTLHRLCHFLNPYFYFIVILFPALERSWEPVLEVVFSHQMLRQCPWRQLATRRALEGASASTSRTGGGAPRALRESSLGADSRQPELFIVRKFISPFCCRLEPPE